MPRWVSKVWWSQFLDFFESQNSTATCLRANHACIVLDDVTIHTQCSEDVLLQLGQLMVCNGSLSLSIGVAKSCSAVIWMPTAAEAANQRRHPGC